MNAYLPTTAVAATAPVLLLLAEAALLPPLLRGARQREGVAAAWVAQLTALGLADALTAGQPAGFRMVALITVLFLGMKLVVLASARAAGQTLPGHARLAAFTFLWPGMNPALATVRHAADLAAARRLARHALLYIGAGAALYLAARITYHGPGVAGTAWAAVPLVAAMLAFSLIVHFGLFGLIAAAWRAAGFPARELFRAPWRARSLEDFWGRRWNLAYVEMITLAVYRPATRRWGVGPARTLAFLVSGLLHEAAISFPVGTGYGLPTAYFLLQVFAIRLERRLKLRGTTARRAWMWAWLLLPAPILFFPAFVRGIVVPLLGGV